MPAFDTRSASEPRATQGRSPIHPPAVSAPVSLRLEAAGATDKGPARPENEDYFYAPPPVEGVSYLALVADGVGGHAAGEVASRMACDAVRRTLEAIGLDRVSPQDLIGAFAEAHRVVQREGHGSREGMGTTLVAALVRGAEALVAHIGDTRLYHVRDGSAVAVTEDQTVPKHLVRVGMLAPEDAARHPRRHVLTQAIGISPAVTPWVGLVTIVAGDVLVLATDGVCGVLEDEELAAIASSGLAEVAARRLVEAAVERGQAAMAKNPRARPDNATAVVVRVLGS